MKRMLLLSGILLVGAMLFACAAEPATEPVAPEAAKPVPVEIEKEGWEAEWEKLVKEAKKEGALNLYMMAPSPKERQFLMDALKKDFAISLYMVVGLEIIQKLLTEYRSGLYIADIVSPSARSAYTQLKPSGTTALLEPFLLHQDLTDPDKIREVWHEGKLGWIDKNHHIISYWAYLSSPMAINTDLVKLGEVSSYGDLLNPKWKGRIVWNDFTIAGTGTKHFMYMDEIMGRDFIEQLAKQDITFINNYRLQIEWLAKGKYPISLSNSSATLREAIAIGAPIAEVLPKEGSDLSVGHTLTIMKKAPHPNAAKLFLNWLMTKEVQTTLSQISGRQSRRTDVPYDHIAYPREPGKKYMFYDREETFALQDEYTRQLGPKIFKTR